MVLTQAEAIAYTKNPQNKELISFLQAKYKTMRAHVTGIGAGMLIQKIEGFERNNIMEARKKLMLSNKDLNERVMKPREKIYTAKGGIESYNLRTNNQITEFKEFLSNCAGKRTSLKQYISQAIQTAYDIDPMGLKWVGINGDGEPYPAYKCITGIHDYEIEDGTPEYVVFKCSPKEVKQLIKAGIVKGLDAAKNNDKVYRCVCDGYDRILTWIDGSEPKIVDELPNPFGRVPGEVVSDIPCEDEDGNVYYESCLYKISELLSQYVFGRSIYNIAYSQVAYPIMWMQAAPCPTCQGKKVIAPTPGVPNNGDMKCPECKGSGKYPHIQNSDTYIWEFQNDKDKSVPRPPLGIIETAIDNLQYMKDNNVSVEDMMNMTVWGVVKVMPNAKIPDSHSRPGNNTSETAFEADLNEEPKRDEQKKFSRWGGNSYKWYADTMGELKYGDDYLSSSILWGDGYANRSADEILTRLQKAQASEAPSQALLQSIHLEYIDSKYENNPLEWRKYWLFYLGEPYFFYTVEQVDLWMDIPMIQKLEKKMYGEFMCTLTDQVVASIPDENPVPYMQQMIRDFVSKKYIADKQADALLFASDGSMLNIGDNARVKVQMAKDPADTGKIFKVKGMDKDKGVAILECQGVEFKGYGVNELERVF